MKNIFLSSLGKVLGQRLIKTNSSVSISRCSILSPLSSFKIKTARRSSNICPEAPIIDFGYQLRNLISRSGSLVLLVFTLSTFPLTSVAQNKVVVVPLGGQELTTEQTDILEFFSYDAANERLTIRGTAANPLNQVFFENVNVRGASQVRQDFTTNGTDIPGNSIFVEIEEENITLGAAPNNSQAVVVHAFASIDSATAITCPCEFRGRIIQDDGQPNQVTSPAVYLEVEGGDGDIDATISHTFAFIATARTQNYSFHVQLFADVADPDGGFYKVDEAGITLTSFGLAGLDALKVPTKGLTEADRGPEATLPQKN